MRRLALRAMPCPALPCPALAFPALKFPGLLLLALLLPPSAVAASPDPRPEIVRLQIEGRFEAALAAGEEVLRDRPEAAEAWGIPYLRGYLLERLGRTEEAGTAWAETLAQPGPLTPFIRLRLARNHASADRPEVAAGILATLLSGPNPSQVTAPATSLLVSAIEETGDCRSLQQIENWPVRRDQKRRLRLARAECRLRSGQTATAATELTALLREDDEDLTARLAAERLAALPETFTADPAVDLLLGMVFYHHREFALAAAYLETGIRVRYAAGAGLTRTEFSYRYALARSHFWQGRYQTAAHGFATLAQRTRTDASTSKSLYQRARSLELDGEWETAAVAFREAFKADTRGDFSGAALVSAMRLEWRQGREESALELYRSLRSRGQWRSTATRASLFLATSDIVRGRADRAADWLDHADGRRSAELEVAYWDGRLAELVEDPGRAVDRYLEVRSRDPYHPLSDPAARRLQAPALAGAARSEGERLAASSRSEDLFKAWLALGDVPAGRAARASLRQSLARSSRNRQFLDLQIVPPEAWPLWRATLRRPQEILLSLGIWEEAGAVVQRHFPLTNPNLAVTGSRLLFLGGEHKRSLYIAEILGKRVPAELPEEMLPEVLRRLLNPLPWSTEILGAGARQGVDPYLLAGVIREESRFDENAVSGASARGLTQFVYATAQRLAAVGGFGEITPSDLHDPAVSIALGALYLEELGQRFDGLEPMMLAGYNAGENQARLWRSHCFSDEPEEYFSKVTFRESRGYLRKVLTSRARYRALYPSPRPVP